MDDLTIRGNNISSMRIFKTYLGVCFHMIGSAILRGDLSLCVKIWVGNHWRHINLSVKSPKFSMEHYKLAWTTCTLFEDLKSYG